MALEGASIRFCATTTCSDLGRSRNSGLAFNLRFRLEKFRKWEFCCLGVFAKRDTSSVEDHKSYVPGIEPSRTVEQTQGNESRGNHKALNLLPIKGHLFVPLEENGVPGAYSEAAAMKAFPKCEIVPCKTFEETLKAVEMLLVDKAVLPIENSIGGSIYGLYDLLISNGLNIVGEVKLQINHCLLGLPGVTMEGIVSVKSHPQALAQCDMTLSKLGVVRIIADNTAIAAQKVASTGLRDTGAVASARAAKIYGLDILAEKIQDVDNNITRFLILSKEPIIPGIYDRPYKTSIIFILKEGPGVLFKALAVFALGNFNLTKIDRHPHNQHHLMVDGSNEGSIKYMERMFYLDFEASMAEPRAQQALLHLQEFTRFVRVLGSYPVGTVQKALFGSY
ncbi:arogenate dehydratase/prephenate dehydratase 1, chloroplastic-like [Quercus lobata]|uniref:arogenate dehydratase/prephenate dehydratase 1, chloroplastic-like n=1 Tax=Quercus lobata TaxID=97700 RepID=UPI0012442C6F|nr:arogenate dehydratase/prephenate dehydratase 1, chloroplastic-like [Quercus lobata]